MGLFTRKERSDCERGILVGENERERERERELDLRPLGIEFQ